MLFLNHYRAQFKEKNHLTDNIDVSEVKMGLTYVTSILSA